jgi:hypothetical protein
VEIGDKPLLLEMEERGDEEDKMDEANGDNSELGNHMHKDKVSAPTNKGSRPSLALNVSRQNGEFKAVATDHLAPEESLGMMMACCLMEKMMKWGTCWKRVTTQMMRYRTPLELMLLNRQIWLWHNRNWQLFLQPIHHRAKAREELIQRMSTLLSEQSE